jgi:hypothetical protein
MVDGRVGPLLQRAHDRLGIDGCADGKTARVAIDYVFGTLDLDPTASHCPDQHLVAGTEAGVLKRSRTRRM